MRVSVRDKTDVVCQQGLFGVDTEIFVGRKIEFEIPITGEECQTQGDKLSRASSAEMQRAALRSLGFEHSHFEFGKEKLSIQRRFTGGKIEACPAKSYLGQLRRSKAMDEVRSFMLASGALDETKAKFKEPLWLACDRIRYASGDESLDLIVDSFKAGLSPFLLKDVNISKQLRTQINRALTKLAKEGVDLTEKERETRVQEIVNATRAKATSKSSHDDDLQNQEDLKEKFHLHDPDLESTRILNIDWTLISSNTDIQELLGLVAEIKEQREIGDEESRNYLRSLLEAFSDLQRKLRRKQNAGVSFSWWKELSGVIKHCQQEHMFSYTDSQVSDDIFLEFDAITESEEFISL